MEAQELGKIFDIERADLIKLNKERYQKMDRELKRMASDRKEIYSNNEPENLKTYVEAVKRFCELLEARYSKFTLQVKCGSRWSE